MGVATTVPSIVAHRGDPFRERENTLPSFVSAMAAGADRLELDVRTTADGVSVVLHDMTLLRLWGLPVRVGDVPWEVVAGLGYADVRVPRLLDVLDAVDRSGVGLLIDVLTREDAAAALACVAAHRQGGGQVDVHWCGLAGAMEEVRHAYPSAVIYLASEDGHVDRDLLAQVRPSYLNVDATLLSPGIIAEAHALGLRVSAWTIDDEWAMRLLVGLGVDSVTTNRPGLLAAVLAEAGDGLLVDPSAVDPVGGASGTGLDDEEVETAYAVARHVGEWAGEYLAEVRPQRVDTKAHSAEIVTDVDIAVESRVRRVLASEFPAHVVVGEEAGGRARVGVPVWYCDPVDGTTNYAAGLGWSSFSLALALEHEPVVAVVADPQRREVVHARAGRGSWCGSRRLTVRHQSGLAGMVVLTEWAGNLPWPGQLDVLLALSERGATSRIMGSGTLALASVALGRCDAAILGEFDPIDHLAGVLLVREAGGVILGLDGSEGAWPGSGPFVAGSTAAARLVGDVLAAAVNSSRGPGVR